MLRVLLILSMLALPLGAEAQTDRYRDEVVKELREDGFANIRVSRTFLGRLRFRAESGTASREIVLNPKTGVILRDYTRFRDEDDDDDDERGNSGSGSSSGGSSGTSGSGEEDDDDDDDDNSGSGSGDD